ncbi:MAG: prepilin-type N-terminal cleavage/methylation domain-containing protein [Parcubacteria group bacterium]|nr:prepilin-type N-terminal cleavage/methylation domain-containing protein [Parcubacteria group bacterium]
MKHTTSKKTKTRTLDMSRVSCSRFHDRGFTLVELIVAIAVFATVVTVVSSIFVSSVGSQRKNVNNQDVLDNARYVLETMGRSIRQSVIVTGNGTGSTLTVNHPTKGVTTYVLDNSQVKESVGGNTVALSSSNVSVQGLTFIVQGNGSTDNIQPKVTISISLKNAQGAASTESIANLQTTVTPRNLQIQ